MNREQWLQKRDERDGNGAHPKLHAGRSFSKWARRQSVLLPTGDAAMTRIPIGHWELARNRIALILLSGVIAGCATPRSSPETIAALSRQFTPDVSSLSIDSDCIFSAPVRNSFKGSRQFGTCMFNEAELRLFSDGNKPSLKSAWVMKSIKSYRLHDDTFTVVTDQGNFGLVVKEHGKLAEIFKRNRIRENSKLPVFESNDPAPWSWM
jgi:hypothetical protein